MPSPAGAAEASRFLLPPAGAAEREHIFAATGRSSRSGHIFAAAGRNGKKTFYLHSIGGRAILVRLIMAKNTSEELKVFRIREEVQL